jgi:hypothetical protein
MPNVVRVPSLRMQDIDGSPDVQGVERIYTTNGFLSNLGNGSVLLSMSGSGGVSSLAVQDVDGAPNVSNVSRIYLTNGFLSDLGGGSVLISLSGTGAPTDATYWVEDANSTLTNEVVVGTTGITTAAYGSRQGAAKAGRLFLPNNGFVIERDTGAAWAPWGPLHAFTAPVDGDFSWDNQGGASVSTTNGGIFLSIPTSGSTSLRSRYKAAPSPAYVITAAFLINFVGINTFDTFGFIWSDGTKFASFGVGYNTGVTGGYYLLSGKWTNSTTYSANYVSVSYQQFGPVVWLRIADDNTNRICSISSDGQNWVAFHSVTRTDFLTPTRVGFGASATNGTYTSGLTLLSWKET